MSRGRLTVALSSLLFLILAATSEANTFKCYHQTSCNKENNFWRAKTCTDACYIYNCVVKGNSMKGFGCKDDVEKACVGTNITSGDYDKLKNIKDENATFVHGDNYVIISCKADNCNNREVMSVQYLLNDDEVLYKEYEDAKNALESKVAGTKSGPCPFKNGLVDDTPTNGTAASNATQAPGVDPTTNGSAALAGIPLILGWIIFGLIAAQI